MLRSADLARAGGCTLHVCVHKLVNESSNVDIIVNYVCIYQGRSQAIQRVGSLRTKSGPSNSFYNYGDFKTCMS